MINNIILVDLYCNTLLKKLLLLCFVCIWNNWEKIFFSLKLELQLHLDVNYCSRDVTNQTFQFTMHRCKSNLSFASNFSLLGWIFCFSYVGIFFISQRQILLERYNWNPVFSRVNESQSSVPCRCDGNV